MPLRGPLNSGVRFCQMDEKLFPDQSPRIVVSGRLLDAESGEPLVGLTVVVESGIRDERSSLYLEGIGRPAHTGHEGEFGMVFFTNSKIFPPEVPEQLQLSIAFEPGKYSRRHAVVQPHNRIERRGNRLWIDIGDVRVSKKDEEKSN